jgi:hypothetical protein
VWSDAVRHFAGDAAHDPVDRRQVDRDQRVLDRARIEQGHHQVDAVVLALDVERRAALRLAAITIGESHKTKPSSCAFWRTSWIMPARQRN